MRNNPMRPAKLPLLGSNQDSPDPESEATGPVAGAAGKERVEIPSVSASSHTIRHTVSHPRPARRVYSIEGRRKIAAAQRRRRPMALTRECKSLAPVEGHEPTFAPFAPNQLRCRACCRADKYNLAKNKVARAARRAS